MPRDDANMTEPMPTEQVAAVARHRRSPAWRRPSSRLPAMLLGAWLAPLLGCAATTANAPPPGEPDRPVPASEPRAEVTLHVDLPAARGCDEQLDLALYQNRGVELVAWDRAGQRCDDRLITIRYLSRQLTRAELLELVKAHATRVTPVEEHAKPDAQPSHP